MSRVVELNSSDDEHYFIQDNDRCVIFFGSQGCHHCHDISPIFNEMSQRYPHIAFGHVETSKFNVDNLAGVPTFVGYTSGRPNDDHIVIGANKKALARMVESI